MSILPSKFCWGDGVDQPSHIVAKSDFTSDKMREDGLCVYCKTCNAARQRAWKRANPVKVREAKKVYLNRIKEGYKNG